MQNEFRTFRSLASFKKVAAKYNLKVKLTSRSNVAQYYQARTAEGVIVGFFCEGPAGWLSVKTTGHIARTALSK